MQRGNEVAGSADGAGPRAPEPLVRIRGVSKRFGATQALDDVDIDVYAGSILALLGQNGAGKSTIIKVLAGVYGRDSGEIDVCGDPFDSPQARGRIAFIHQDLGLVPGLSAAENIALGVGYPKRSRLINWRESRRLAERALEIVGSDIDPRTRVAELSRTDRSMLAIARALVVDAQVLVLDEPTASLPADETEVLFAVLRRLKADGIGMVYVSHRLDEVFAISDRVTIMRDGKVVSSGLMAATARAAGHRPRGAGGDRPGRRTGRTGLAGGQGPRGPRSGRPRRRRARRVRPDRPGCAAALRRIDVSRGRIVPTRWSSRSR